jgi:hypothetical protein
MNGMIVVCQHWIESERGWGQRPDGVSLHLTLDDVKDYVKAYWETMPNTVPYEYSKPVGKPTLVRVNDSVYEAVKSGKNGRRYWQHEWREMNAEEVSQ